MGWFHSCCPHTETSHTFTNKLASAVRVVGWHLFILIVWSESGKSSVSTCLVGKLNTDTGLHTGWVG